MPNGKRLWRTEDGRLVEDGHLDARLLAYGIDDELTEEDAELFEGFAPDPEPPADPEPDADPEKVEAPATAKVTARKTAAKKA